MIDLRNSKRRIVITGMGVISAVGYDTDEFWKHIITGKSGAVSLKPKRIWDSYCTQYGMLDPAKIEELKENYFTEEERNSCGLCASLALLASKQAVENARLSIDESCSERVSVLIGSANGESYDYEEHAEHPEAILHQNQGISTMIAKSIKASGEIFNNVNACSASNLSIAYGCELISQGRADYVVAGGADVFSDIIFGGFSRIKALVTEKVKPFDITRSGIMIGEAAGTVILEDYESAKQRGAHIYCEITGIGRSNDAYHITAPDPESRGVIVAMEEALADAGLKPVDIDYISLHGTGTVANDWCEMQAVREVFGETAKDVYASSIKGALGHTLGAASVLEAICCALTLETGILPHTSNTKQTEPECPFQLIIDESIRKDVKVLMNNSFAFGGSNCILIMKKVIEK